MARFVVLTAVQKGRPDMPVAVNPQNVTHASPLVETQLSQHDGPTFRVSNDFTAIWFSVTTHDEVDGITVRGSFDEVLAALSPSLPGVA